MAPPRAPNEFRELTEQIRGLEGQISRLTTLVEVANSRSATWTESTWPAHLKLHEQDAADRAVLNERLTSLENDRQRAQGAAWAGKAVFGLLLAVVGAAGTVFGWVAREPQAARPTTNIASPIGPR